MDFVDNKSRYLHTYLVEPNLCFASLFRPVCEWGGIGGGGGRGSRGDGGFVPTMVSPVNLNDSLPQFYGEVDTAPSQADPIPHPN